MVLFHPVLNMTRRRYRKLLSDRYRCRRVLLFLDNRFLLFADNGFLLFADNRSLFLLDSNRASCSWFYRFGYRSWNRH